MRNARCGMRYRDFGEGIVVLGVNGVAIVGAEFEEEVSVEPVATEAIHLIFGGF